MSGRRNSKAPREQAYLPANLRYLCSFYSSISYVCRKVGINRQQFNKYLSGRIKPSIHILKRTCDFFGVDIEELFLAPSKLKATLGARARGSGRDGDAGAGRAKSFALSKIGEALAEIRSDSAILKKYEGYYFRYNYCFDGSGRVIRSVFSIREHDGVYVTRLLERVQHQSNTARRLTTLKYSGLILAMSGCFFNVEYDTILKSCVGHAAFSYLQRPGQRLVTGIHSSFSTSSGRPTASRVVLERITRALSLREMINRSGTFHISEGKVDADILSLIGNTVTRDEDVFSSAKV